MQVRLFELNSPKEYDIVQHDDVFYIDFSEGKIISCEDIYDVVKVLREVYGYDDEVDDHSVLHENDILSIDCFDDVYTEYDTYITSSGDVVFVICWRD